MTISPSPLIGLPSEDLAARPPTANFFRRLLTELASSDLAWTDRLVGRLDYAYAEISTRAIAANRISVLRRLGVHLGQVLAVRRSELIRDDARYFYRWTLLAEIAERRVLWWESIGRLADSPWFGDVARLLSDRGALVADLASGLDTTTSRVARILDDLARWQLVRVRRSPAGEVARLTPVGRRLARRRAILRGAAPAWTVQATP